MTAWDAFLLGIVQGATEFLPVSSSGHLVIVQSLLSVSVEGVAFEVIVHLGTLFSIMLVYRSRITELTVGVLGKDQHSLSYAGLLFVATIPAGLIGILAKEPIELLFDAPAVPGIALLVTGVVLWSSRSAMGRQSLTRPTLTSALLIGVAQACALIPGISRSGATVVAAMWLGLEAREAAAFSFLMAVPVIAGAAVLQIPDLIGHDQEGLSISLLVIGGIAAGVTGVLAIRMFVGVLARRSFHFFAPYCWTVGLLYLAYLFVN